MNDGIRFDLIEDDLSDEVLDGERNRFCAICIVCK
jgi:hypothetical protein